DVHGELIVPVFDGQLVDRLLNVQRCHVDEHVKSTERVDGVVNDTVARLRLTEIDLDEEDAATERAQRVSGFLGFGSRASVRERDIRAAARQFGRHHRADSPATGYQRYPPGELHSTTSLVDAHAAVFERA